MDSNERAWRGDYSPAVLLHRKQGGTADFPSLAEMLRDVFTIRNNYD